MGKSILAYKRKFQTDTLGPAVYNAGDFTQFSQDIHYISGGKPGYWMVNPADNGFGLYYSNFGMDMETVGYNTGMAGVGAADLPYIYSRVAGENTVGGDTILIFI